MTLTGRGLLAGPAALIAVTVLFLVVIFSIARDAVMNRKAEQEFKSYCASASLLKPLDSQAASAARALLGTPPPQDGDVYHLWKTRTIWQAYLGNEALLRGHSKVYMDGRAAFEINDMSVAPRSPLERIGVEARGQQLSCLEKSRSWQARLMRDYSGVILK